MKKMQNLETKIAFTSNKKLESWEPHKKSKIPSADLHALPHDSFSWSMCMNSRFQGPPFLSYQAYGSYFDVGWIRWKIDL